MHRFIEIILLFSCYYHAHCVQPNFPSQVVFTVDNGQRLYAIDEVNQRAFVSIKDNPAQSAYVFQNFPYAPAGTPQSQNYVQLITTLNSKSCVYGTYWKYGGNSYNYFPTHWQNTTSFQIKNYLDLNYRMVYSENQSVVDEDYYYSDETCYDEVLNINPCFRIYFKKATDTPLRSIQLQTVSQRRIFRTTTYQVLSIGKPDDKYFADIPKNWYTSCLDINLQIRYFTDADRVGYHSYQAVGVSLFAPPHRINGNETVTISWNITGCNYVCLTWTPSQLTFNSRNFNQKQNLTFYRVDDSGRTTFKPTFVGGGFHLVPPDLNAISFEGS